MSIQGISTPSSTTGSTAESPAASQPPPTPVSPEYVAPGTPPSESNDIKQEQQQPASSGPAKRKPSRRANTAERRATHNAVERQRRETLNGRFLDLAALLPNLATVRRPSKSAIVNSSIALIHSQRRQRLIAAREVRLLKLESDALRRELNEWRDRSGLPRVDEPPRNAEFMSLLALGEGEGEGWWDDHGIDEMGEEEKRAYELVMGAQEEDGEDGLVDVPEEDEYPRGMSRQSSAYGQGGAVNLQHIMPRNMGRGPAIASPTNIAFDPASHLGFPGGGNTMFEPNGHPHPMSHSLPVHPNFNNVMNFSNDLASEKVAAWNTQLYNQLPQAQNNVGPGQWAQQQQNVQQAMYTPPGTANSVNTGTASPQQQIPNPFSQQAQQFVPSFQQQSIGSQNMFAGHDADDASSVHSVGSHDGSGRSVGGSPQPLAQAYEVNSAGMIRRPNLTVTVPNVGGQQWNTQAQPQQIAAGGGGGRHFPMTVFM